MIDLHFEVAGAKAVPFAAAPQLVFKLLVTQPGQAGAKPPPIHSIALRCQIRIEPARRHYKPAEQERLADLFGGPERWGQTLRAMLWTHAAAQVPPFTDRVIVDMPVPCTFDFNVAATKFFYALDDGDVPLSLLFSGTIFYEAEVGGLHIVQIPWDNETSYRLPVQVWKDMIDQYYPNSAWLCLQRGVFDQLYRYKRRQGMATWEQALESLLAAVE
jgi:hypothetical protein